MTASIPSIRSMQSIPSIPQDDRKEPTPSITVEDLMELADYAPVQSGVEASITWAPGHTMRLIGLTHHHAESAMRDFCTRLAARLNSHR